MSASKVVLRIVSISFSVLIFIVVVFGICKAGQWAYDFGYRVFTEAAVDSEPGRDVILQVTEKMSAYDMATAMENKGLIRDARLFWVQLKLSSYANDIEPGIYTLNTSMTAREMIRNMATVEENTEEKE